MKLEPDTHCHILQHHNYMWHTNFRGFCKSAKSQIQMLTNDAYIRLFQLETLKHICFELTLFLLDDNTCSFNLMLKQEVQNDYNLQNLQLAAHPLTSPSQSLCFCKINNILSIKYVG